jgi:hypothetical protein
MILSRWFLTACDLSVPRTFPNHRKLSKGASGCDDMRDILVAYANHNPSLGYCQGMSYVAGMLLVTFDNVEDAFWTFLTLMDQHMRGSYDARVSGMIKDGKIFERLLAERMPSLAAHLERHAISSLLYITPWFMTLFTHISAPWCTVLRIWDVIALEGKSALFRFALALMHLHERELLAAEGVEKILPVLLKVNPDAEKLLQFAATSMPPIAELVALIDAADARVEEAEQERPRLTPTSSIAAFGNGMLSRMMSSLTTPRKNLSAALDRLRSTADYVPTLTPLTTPTTSPSKRRRRGASPPPPQQREPAAQPAKAEQQTTPQVPTPAAATTALAATATVPPSSVETRESFRAFSTSSPTPKRKHFSAVTVDSPRAASTPPKTVLVQIVSPDAPETEPEELVEMSKPRRALRRTVATKQLVKSRLASDDSYQQQHQQQQQQNLLSPSTPSPARRALLSPGSAGKKRKPDEISMPR